MSNLDDFVAKFASKANPPLTDREKEVACLAMGYALASLPDRTGEPVAWQIRNLLGDMWSGWRDVPEDTAAHCKSLNRADIDVRPLYATPPDAEQARLRERVETRRSGDAQDIADRLRRFFGDPGDARRLALDAAMMIEYLNTAPLPAEARLDEPTREAAAKVAETYCWERYREGGKLKYPAVFTSHTKDYLGEAIRSLEATHGE